MPKKLTAAQIESYHQDGFCFPIAGIGQEHAARARADLENYERDLGAPLTAAGREERYKLHVRLPWACDLVRDPAVLDAVEDIIGPDILVWTSTFFIKERNTTAITMWHQDATYFGLRPHHHITAWIALSEASETAGCMEFVPESGAARLYQHKANADPDSINGGGQTIAERFDKGNTVRGMLKMGEFSLHHTLC
ncbi:MAG: phytanoyl-CoA dioxygenase family protein, partial [Pseudomonadota bacterium]|nr:phytanoyl-CoA dioxygenase family protein [Pseudomonadota bacterium]